MLSSLDLEVVWVEVDRCTTDPFTTASAQSVAQRAVQIQLKRIAVLIRFGVVSALVYLALIAGLVLADLVPGEL